MNYLVHIVNVFKLLSWQLFCSVLARNFYLHVGVDRSRGEAKRGH